MKYRVSVKLTLEFLENVSYKLIYIYEIISIKVLKYCSFIVYFLVYLMTNTATGLNDTLDQVKGAKLFSIKSLISLIKFHPIPYEIFSARQVRSFLRISDSIILLFLSVSIIHCPFTFDFLKCFSFYFLVSLSFDFLVPLSFDFHFSFSFDFLGSISFDSPRSVSVSGKP